MVLHKIYYYLNSINYNSNPIIDFNMVYIHSSNFKYNFNNNYFEILESIDYNIIDFIIFEFYSFFNL
jgi:hypothetical protein